MGNRQEEQVWEEAKPDAWYRSAQNLQQQGW